ncbi:TonB-dependent receptor [Leptobacterium sp. I13]|uniref:SusC/RagA family TonB-linked outer membrane protein n=1 Tax=Leptobacterium meishanense TaxID=3128904 RepID=UPI0030EE27EA
MRTKFSGILTLLLAFIVQLTFAQQKTVSGTITDQNGLPLPGVNVIVKGTTNGTQSDFDGNYSISAAVGQTLVFTYLGQRTEERAIGASNTINVQMVEDAQALEEVVVVGYGQQSERKIIQNVSLVKQEDIENIQATSPQDLLQGQSSGVAVTGASGVLGSASVIRVRGVNSLTGGSNPLIVIDGVPIDDQNQTLSNGSNTGLNPLSYVNTEDIESFTVLKDAAATSLYGTRGSNGVILITTKRGKLGDKPKVTIGYSASINEATFVEDMMNIQQFTEFRNILNGTNNPVPEGFDWLSAVDRQGVTTNQDISVSGGSEKSTYYFGLNHSDAEGFIIGNSLEKTSARINVNTQATDWLNAGMNLAVTTTLNDRISAENSTFSPWTVGFLQRPDVLPRDSEGDFVNTGFIANVLAIEALDLNQVQTTKITGNTYIEAELYEGLKAKIDFGVDRTQIEETNRSLEVNSPGGFAGNRVVFINRHLITGTLNYNKSFGDHTVSALVGTSYEETRTNVTRAQGTGFLSDQLRNITSASIFPLTFSSRTQFRLYGQIFSRINYDYKGKYLLEGSFRRDGSSRFGANKKFGNFWAVAGGWIVSDEAFMQDSFFDFLSIRASYGTTGNDRIGNFPSLGTFASSNYNNIPGIIPSSAENVDLQWEETATFDVGIKTGFFGNRVRFNANYYIKRTDNLLLNVPLPSQTGLNSVARNAGEIENRGFEFDLSTVNIRTEDFEWTTKINLSTIDNEVISLPGANLDNQGREFISGSGNQRAVVGESANSFYMIRYVGVNPQTGDAEWLDFDGNITTSPTPDDRRIVGDAQPDFYGGITNTFKYKNFDLNIFMNYTYGNDILIGGIRFTDAPIGFNMSTRLLDYWTQPGDNAYFPALNSSTVGLFRTNSTNQLKDGSFIRLKNVTLGYNVPKKFLEKMNFVDSIRIYATGTNLLTIKDSDLGDRDPEVTNNVNPLQLGESFFVAPQTKSYLIGARVTF